MRAISPAALAVLSSETVPMVLLVEMLLTQPLRMSSASVPITYGGAEYLGLGHFGAVEEVEDSPGEYKNLVFALNGVASDLISIALSENIRGKPVTMRLGVMDPNNFTVLDAPVIWAGTLDQMPIQMGKETGIVNVTAEHRGVTFARPKPLNYTDNDQRRLFPGDTSLKTIQSQSTHPDVWPAASYFKR
jgi:hypothetical protein